MSELVERVARAIRQARGHYGPNLTPGALKEARAAIEAMRIPTAAMVDASESRSQRGGFTPETTWGMMIDEALK